MPPNFCPYSWSSEYARDKLENSTAMTWKTKSPGQPLYPRHARHNQFRNKKGAATLKEVALKWCAHFRHDLSPEVLEHVDWHYAGMIIRYLKQTDALTFKVWSTFYQMYPKQKDLSHQFRVLLNNDDAAKESVIAALGSLNQDCLRTFFCDTDFSDTSLVSLTEISSLAALAFCSELGLLWPLDEWPLDETIYKDWCRVVKERKALTELKTLYLQEMIQDVPALLHSLSALPDLTLVGFANDSVLEDVNNRRDFIPQMKAHGQWVPASDDQMIQFTDLIYAWGAYSQLAIADRLRLLYDFANEISHTSSAGTGAKASEHAQDGEKVTLSMTDDSIQVPRTKKQLLWYIRKEPPKRSFSKRQRETQTVTATAADKEYSGAKKRKARQTEQQDIWCLLGQFG